MRLRRRRPTHGLLDDHRPSATEGIGKTVVDDVDVLAARLGSLEARILGLEARLADADEASVVLPDQGDVLDAQVRTAQLSADLHLVAIELRAELQRLQGEWPASTAADLAHRLAEISADA